MHILPVMDLMGGWVVRGVGGRREEYRPIESVLAPDARPASIARGLAALGFAEAYVADLDAIAGAEPAWTIYQGWIEQGLDLWIDAGVSTIERAAELAAFRAAGRPISAIIAGLESLSGPGALEALASAVGRKRLVFSLDLRAAQPIVGERSAWHGLDAVQIATIAMRLGVRRMIVLDLARVGMGQGVGTEPICRRLRAMDEKLEIVAGGGVRSLADLRSLEAAGCDRALVASALHDGRLKAEELSSFGARTPNRVAWSHALPGKPAVAPQV